MLDEANLFCEWYIKKKLPKTQRKKFNLKFKKIMKRLSLKLKLKNNVFVHRDFHVSNLMLVKKKIGIIDSQDALIGNKAYDLASLIDDVRFKTSKLLKYKIYNYYIKKQKIVDKKKFKNDFEILSVMRNFKIIGIFIRLACRDKKTNYLKFIPYAWKLIDMRIRDNQIFSDLNFLLNIYLKKK